MQPIEIVAVMRSKGWLRKEPACTREKITSSVRYLLITHQMGTKQLALELGDVAPTYIRRKLSENRWRIEDLDLLEQTFGISTSDIVAGYKRLQHIDLENTEEVTHG